MGAYWLARDTELLQNTNGPMEQLEDALPVDDTVGVAPVLAVVQPLYGQRERPHVEVAPEIRHRLHQPQIADPGLHADFLLRHKGNTDVYVEVSRLRPARDEGRDATGRLARTIDSMPDPAAARHEPSMQLVGRNGSSSNLDLGVLQARGVRLAGRLRGTEGRTALFDDGLADQVADADRRLHRFLDAVDEYVDQVGLGPELWPATRPRPVTVEDPPERLDLRAEGIGTVLLATGYRPDHGWLRLPVTDATGHIVQRRGVTPAPGVYVVGQRFQHRRDSGCVDGARHDAQAVVHHLLVRAGRSVRPSTADAVGSLGTESPAS